MVRVYIDNYGCTANYDNGAIIGGILYEGGHSIVKDINDCDVVIINSCSVKNVTVNKIMYKIEKIKDKQLIITGCMPISEKEKLTKYLKNNVALVSTQNITKINEVVDKVLNNEEVILLDKRKEIKLGLPKVNLNDETVSIQIAEGCLSFCNFCSTKLAKGNLFSYPKEQIVAEVKKYVTKGYKKINLTATDSGCYGFDLGYNLADLLNEIVNIDGEFIVRVGMGNPRHVIKYADSLIGIFKNEKIMKFVHLPVQSGSNKVLREMHRDHNIEDLKNIVNKFRKNIPGITISSDIIVGYPTETKEDFKKTIELVKKLRFEVLNISKFAPRTGTAASKLKQIPSQLIKERSTELSIIHDKVKNN